MQLFSVESWEALRQRRDSLAGRRLFLLLLACLPFTSSVADDGRPSDVAPPPRVVATVDEVPIFAGQVDQARRRVPRHASLTADEHARLDRLLLEQLIEQQMVLNYLERRGETVSPHHIDAAVERLRQKLARRDETLEEHLVERGIDERALRREWNWRLSWEAYLNKRITDDVLQQHFDAHREQFDGSQRRLRHILWKSRQAARSADELPKLAERVRADIIAGRTTFAEAARRHSESPSAQQDGDIGWIERHGAMPETFAAAAFALKPGDISRPVATSFGVHLIHCVEIRAGAKTWQEVADALRRSVIQNGFRKIVDIQRPRVRVQRTSK